MARFDKYDPVSGGFRARIGWQPVAGEVGDVIPVAVDGNGRLQKAAAATAKGVVCLDEVVTQGDVVDAMTHGEIVDVATSGDNVTTPTAGADLYAGAAGATSNSAPGAGVNVVRLGFFAENWRLIVRVQPVQG